MEYGHFHPIPQGMKFGAGKNPVHVSPFLSRKPSKNPIENKHHIRPTFPIPTPNHNSISQ